MTDLIERPRSIGEAWRKLIQQQAEIERLTDELINLEQVAKDRYCKMQGEIERLKAKLTQDPKDARCQLYKATQKWQQEAERCNAEIERLESINAIQKIEIKQLKGDIQILKLQRDATHFSRCPRCNPKLRAALKGMDAYPNTLRDLEGDDERLRTTR